MTLHPTYGSIIVGGDFRHVNNVLRVRLARLLSNGLLDTTFDPGQGVNGPVRALALQDDERVVVGGFFSSIDNTNRSHLARLNRDGSLDLSFNPGSGPDNPVNALAMQGTGSGRKVLVGGTFAVFNGISRQGIVQLNNNGSVDTSFNPGTGANGAVHALAVQPDGKIIAVGAFTTFNGQPYGRVVRLNANGSVDTSFNTGIGANGEIRAVTLQLDGKIVL